MALGGGCGRHDVGESNHKIVVGHDVTQIHGVARRDSVGWRFRAVVGPQETETHDQSDRPTRQENHATDNTVEDEVRAQQEVEHNRGKSKPRA